MATKYKSMYKYELADAAGVSPRTFTRWLNMHAVQLRKLGVTFQGMFAPVHITTYAENTTEDYLFLGENNRLLWPNDDGSSMRGFRAYFIIHRNNIPAAAAPRGTAARIMQRDNTATGIEQLQGDEVQSTKLLRDGQLIIIRNGVEYNANGQMLK